MGRAVHSSTKCSVARRVSEAHSLIRLIARSRRARLIDHLGRSAPREGGASDPAHPLARPAHCLAASPARPVSVSESRGAFFMDLDTTLSRAMQLRSVPCCRLGCLADRGRGCPHRAAPPCRMRPPARACASPTTIVCLCRSIACLGALAPSASTDRAWWFSPPPRASEHSSASSRLFPLRSRLGPPPAGAQSWLRLGIEVASRRLLLHAGGAVWSPRFLLVRMHRWMMWYCPSRVCSDNTPHLSAVWRHA